MYQGLFWQKFGSISRIYILGKSLQASILQNYCIAKRGAFRGHLYEISRGLVISSLSVLIQFQPTMLQMIYGL